MKFECDVTKENRECVAVIDGDGNLYVKTDSGCVAMYTSTTPEIYGCCTWDCKVEDAIRKFYHGDKITITF